MGPKFQHATILDDKILTIKTFINLKKKLCRIRNSCIIQKARKSVKIVEKKLLGFVTRTQKAGENLSELTLLKSGG